MATTVFNKKKKKSPYTTYNQAANSNAISQAQTAAGQVYPDDQPPGIYGPNSSDNDFYGNSAAAGFQPGQQGFGFFPAYLGDQFPDPETYKAPKSNLVPYKFTDPMEFAKQYGDFNIEQIKKNFGLSQDFALQALDTELKGLEQFTPAAAALKRQQISLDNVFNQQQRLSQVNQALPGVSNQLDEQAARAEAFASGRAPDSITDRMLELGIRSRAADTGAAAGFGSSSVATGKLSDLMSADQRIRLSQYGDQLLSSNINQKAGLFLAPTEYSNAGSQINVTPTLSGSQLTMGFLGDLNQNTLISPTNALSTTIQQNQFEASRAQQNRQFNIGLRAQARQFNTATKNQFALSKFGYNVGYAGTVAGAFQTDLNTQTQLQLMQDYQNTFGDYLNQAQQNNQAGATAEGIAATVAAAANLVGSFIGGGSGGGGVVSGGGTVSGGGGGSSLGASGGGGGGADIAIPGDFADGASVGGPSGSIVVPEGSSAPSGYTPIGGMSVDLGGGQGGGVYLPEAAISVGKALYSSAMGGSGGSSSASAAAQVSAAGVMNTAGISDAYQPGMVEVGVDNTGKPSYGAPTLMTNQDPTLGKKMINTLHGVLDPTGVFSQEDSTAIQRAATIAGDTAFLSQLTGMYLDGNKKGFTNALLARFQQPLVEQITDDPQNQAGLNAAYSAYTMYNNWGRMSAAQKGLGVAALGLQTYKFSTGENFGAKPIIKPTLGADGKVIKPGLTVGEGLQLFQAGYNTYSLVDNWDQLNDVQRVIGGSTNALQIAQLAEQYGMMGSGVSGAVVPNVTTQALTAAGWSTAPNMGVGAIVSASGEAVPQGFTAVSTALDGSVVAVPTVTQSFTSTAAAGTEAATSAAANSAVAQSANASGAAGASGASASGSLSTLGTVASVAGVAYGAYSIYNNWGKTGGAKGAAIGALGGAAMAYGLATMGVACPVCLAGVVAVGALSGGLKVGKHEDQVARDGVRSSFQKMGFVDKEFNVTLADGSKAYLGDDGHSGEHSIRNRELLSDNHKDLENLHAYDVDYTNDLDYASNMGASALAKMITGSSDKPVTDLGGQLGNAAISNIGYGKDMTPDNFGKMQSNLRAIYSQAGVKSKSDAYQLANMMFSEGRVDETGLITMHQGINMVFDDNGYQTAQKLMNGRQQGVKVAAENAASGQEVSNGSGRGRNIKPIAPGVVQKFSPDTIIPKDAKANDNNIIKMPSDPSQIDPGFASSNPPSIKSAASTIKQMASRGLENYSKSLVAPRRNLTKEEIREVNRRRYQSEGASANG